MDALDLAINKFKEAIKSLADQYSKAFGFKNKKNITHACGISLL